MGDPSERERERAERYCEGGELGRWRLSSLPSQFPTTPFLRVSIAWVLRQAVGQCHEQVWSSEQKAENKATICRLQKSPLFYAPGLVTVSQERQKRKTAETEEIHREERVFFLFFWAYGDDICGHGFGGGQNSYRGIFIVPLCFCSVLFFLLLLLLLLLLLFLFRGLGFSGI